jgi:MFS family permease
MTWHLSERRLIYIHSRSKTIPYNGVGSQMSNFTRDFGLIGATQSVQDAFSANIVSLLQAGCFFGALAAAPLGDRLGRRIALALGAISFIVGSIMQVASAGSKPLMFVGRVLGGMVRYKMLS